MEKIAYDPDVEDILYCSRRSLDGVAEFLSETLDKNGTEDSNEYKKHVSISWFPREIYTSCSELIQCRLVPAPRRIHNGHSRGVEQRREGVRSLNPVQLCN